MCTNNAALLRRRLSATPKSVGVVANFFVERALNAEMWDVEGKRYIDFAVGAASACSTRDTCIRVSQPL